MLGIPFYVWDLAERFRDDVVDDFVAEYAAGRTPNPCLRCNEKIKFAAVLDKAVALGFDAVGTGHYARIVARPGRSAAAPCRRPRKDQSYVLGVLTADQLARARVPARRLDQGPTSGTRPSGAGWRSPASRTATTSASSPTVTPPASCGERLGDAPGSDRRHRAGRWSGEHEGAFAYTVGQRRGLRLGVPAADGQPRYVLDVSPVDRTVTVGSRADLAVDRAEGIRPRWCAGPPVGRSALHRPGARARHARCRPPRHLEGDRLLVGFETPVEGLAAGQAVVLYDGDRVVGLGDGRPDGVGRRVSEQPWPAGSATGVGSMPGTDVREAMRVVARRAARPAAPAGAARRAGSAPT